MLPLMRTAWIINRRLLYQFSPWLALYLVMLIVAQTEQDPLKASAFLVMFATVLTIIVALQGLLLPVEEFMLSLPVSRAQMVQAKYASSLASLAAGLLIPLTTATLAHLVAPHHVQALSRDALAITGLAALALASGLFLFLPFIYHLGPGKGFTAFTIVLVSAVVGLVFWKGREGSIDLLVGFFNHLCASKRFTAWVVAAVALFGWISLAFSVWTYRQKVALGGHPLTWIRVRRWIARHIASHPLLALVAALALGGGLVYAAMRTPGPRVQPGPARMEQLIRYYTDRQDFMGSILVARGDKVIFSQGYGFANLDWRVPNTPETKFCIGSITKQFTAASILLLEERGRLKLQDPVKKYFKQAPATWDRITIFHLLTHTSGIPNSDGDGKGFCTTPESLLASLRDKPLDFQPGERFSYSNPGYAVLGRLIEIVSRKSYTEFLQENIFDPLGMRDTYVDDEARATCRSASAYTKNDSGQIERAMYWSLKGGDSVGAICSTTHDLLRWEEGLFGGKLLKPDSLKKMTTPFRDDYALGLGVVSRNGRRIIQHAGGLPGFASQLLYLPEEGLTIAVLSNLPTGAVFDIPVKLEALAHGETIRLPSEHHEIHVNSARMSSFVGAYRFPSGFAITITQEKGHLYGQGTNQPRVELFAEGEKEFFLKAVDAQISFQVDASGRATSLILHQNGIDQSAPRS